MLQRMRRFLIRLLLKKKGLEVDKYSTINYHVNLLQGFKMAKVVNSNVEISSIGDGCFLEHITTYGKIELGNNVSISGPGTILHAVKGKIKIGSFSSIAQNVSIQEFNHNTKLPSTYAMQYHFFSHRFEDDVVTKGDIEIGEDVWIGSNVTILSGVKIGRGSVIAAGAVVTKSMPPYSVVGGVPAKVIKMRFSEHGIKKLEESLWWTWDSDMIVNNKSFFLNEFE